MAKNILNLAADFSRQLASSVSIGDTTCSLNSNLDNDGVALENQRLYGFTVDRGASKEYIVGLHNNGNLTQIVSISRQGASTSGFSKAHRIGTPMEITDWASLYRITSVLNGDIDLDSGTPLKYDGAPSQAEANALATVQFVLDTASGSTVLAFNPLTISGVAGENITEGDWIYLDETDGQWYKTDADDTAKSVDVKIGKSRGTANAEAGIPGGIFVFGSETAGTYTTGQSYYLSNTPGELSTTPGTNEVLVGVGDDNENLVFNHIYPRELSTNTQAALAGGGDFGTPSSTNKFVTEEFVQDNLIKFGGDGSDGALSISSGTTNIDLGGNRVVVKNYTSISITGTGKITFSNPNANGTIIVLKSQGNVTLTSSETPMIDASGLGGSGAALQTVSGVGTRTSGDNGNPGQGLFWETQSGKGGGATSSGGSTGGAASGVISSKYNANLISQILQKYPQVSPGSGGGNGGGASQGTPGGTMGPAGRGGGVLVIECAGAWNFTTTNGISVAGQNATNASATNGRFGGSGGGSGGMFFGFYNTLTTNTGSVNVSAGVGSNAATGGTTGSDSSASGGSGGGSTTSSSAASNAGQNAQTNGTDGVGGLSLISKNTEFV